MLEFGIVLALKCPKNGVFVPSLAKIIWKFPENFTNFCCNFCFGFFTNKDLSILRDCRLQIALVKNVPHKDNNEIYWVVACKVVLAPILEKIAVSLPFLDLKFEKFWGRL